MIRVEHLTKRFGHTVALSDLNVSVGEGTTALLGRNGAGKSTLLNVISGVVLPSAGSVWVGDHPAGSRPAVRETARQLEFPGTAGFLSPNRLKRLLSFSDAEADRLDEYLDRFEVPANPMRHLSHGNQLKLALSVAFARSRSVLLLDEPTSGLDVFGIQVLTDLISQRREAGSVTVVATHQPTLTPDLFDQALVIDLGKSLYQGSLSGLLDLSPTPDSAPTARLASAFEVLLEGQG